MSCKTLRVVHAIDHIIFVLAEGPEYGPCIGLHPAYIIQKKRMLTVGEVFNRDTVATNFPRLSWLSGDNGNPMALFG